MPVVDAIGGVGAALGGSGAGAGPGGSGAGLRGAGAGPGGLAIGIVARGREATSGDVASGGVSARSDIPYPWAERNGRSNRACRASSCGTWS